MEKEKIEQWIPVKGYENYCLVSNLGRVKTLKRKTGRGYPGGNILKPRLTKTGYGRITMAIKGVNKDYYIHRLVAQAFIINPKKYKYINHKDFNKMNNTVSNLEWCSVKINNYHACKNGHGRWKLIPEKDKDKMLKLYFSGESICKIEKQMPYSWSQIQRTISKKK